MLGFIQMDPWRAVCDVVLGSAAQYICVYIEGRRGRGADKGDSSSPPHSATLLGLHGVIHVGSGWLQDAFYARDPSAASARAFTRLEWC